MKITLYAPIDLRTLAAMAGGALHLQGVTEEVAVTHICTDSREADAHTLFCAMRGERVDGHAYAAKAAELGGIAFLCERIPDGLSASFAAILVPDTVEALGRLAEARRAGDLGGLAVTAVTGSVGKTTTKEMLHAVLSTARPTFKKDGNFNSNIGLPLSFLEIPADTPEAVLEMGMSGRGEIAAMTASVRPDIAIIANVGSSHLEHLGTRENIAAAKMEIAEGLREGGILLVNGDEPLLCRAEEGLPSESARVLRLSLAGAANADYTALHVTHRDGGMAFDLNTPEGTWEDLWIPAVGEHLVWAAAFAAAVGQLRGLDVGQVREGLSRYRPAAMRQNSRRVGGLTVIEDCYNAAPESMAAALAVLRLTAHSAGGRRIAVLGDMKELGANTEALHRGVGAEAYRQGVDLLVAVGELGHSIARGAMEAGLPASAVHTVPSGEDYPAAALWLVGEARTGDCILFKASRAMALETMAEAFVTKLNQE